MKYLNTYYDYILESTNNSIYNIDKLKFNIGTRLGMGRKIVYRIKDKTLRVFGTIKSDAYLGVVFTVQNNIVVIKNAYVNKKGEILEDGIRMMDDEILKYAKTLEWCLSDFKDDYPEYIKYIFL